MNVEKYRQMYAQLFGLTVNGIAVLTGDGVIVDVNPAFSTITGYSRLDVIDECFTNLLLFQKVSLFMTWQDLIATMEMKPFYDEVLCIVHKAGEQRIVRMTGYPVWNAAGQLCSYFFSLQDITQQKSVEAALQQSEEKYRSIFNAASDALFVENYSGKIIDANAAACHMLQYTKNELCQLHITDLVKQPLAFNQVLCQSKEQLMAPIEQQYWCKNGKIICCELQVQHFIIGGQQLFVIAARDVTLRKQAEERLRLAETVFDNTIDGILVTDLVGTVLSVNPAFTAMTGYAAEEVINKNCRFLKSEIHDANFFIEMWNRVAATGQWQGEIWNRRKNGEKFSAWLNVKAVADEAGIINKYVGVLSDIIARDHYVAQIRHQAFHDALTGLPNRALYYDRLEHLLACAQRSSQIFAVLFLDLDGFKAVNDNFGHDTGDQLLRAVAERLKASVRSSDTLARMGGDEFTLLLPQLKRPQDALSAAQKIISACEAPYKLNNRAFYVTTSIGIALYPFNGEDAKTLLKQADSAMYSAKQAGKNCYELYHNISLAAKLSADQE
jgi:diguanylate cyclase (GGDEF)-like protein/PAS domain S-box-containing protein